MKTLLNWFDHRTGVKKLLNEALYENIPGGSRWRYVWGSTLVFAFITQAITGIFLWMCYSPSSQTAWESVYYVQYEMQGGWLLRGVHHFMAQAMVVLLAIHLMQVIIDGAYKAPRELNFWLGLVLMKLVLALSLTGYLLPWDQKGYWATNVATNLMTLVPFGKQIQQLVIGGQGYGHHTLTRFFALHAGILPALLVGVLVLHIMLFRRHGITPKKSVGRKDQYFWPEQVLKDAFACLLVLSVVLLLAIHFDVPGLLSGNLPEAHRGADLGAPADPAEKFDSARPEWYFLFLFQLLKYFKQEFISAILIPGGIMLFLFLMPFLGHWKLGHRFNVAFILGLVIGAAILTGLAIHEDYYAKFHEYDPDKYEGDQQIAYAAPFENSREYIKATETAEEDAHRIVTLIRHREEKDGPARMIPNTGARLLLRNDPLKQGPRLFRQHCAACHSHLDDKGEGIAASESSAPNLYGYATRQWLADFLDPEKIATERFFGNTVHSEGAMVDFVQNTWALSAEEENTSNDDETEEEFSWNQQKRQQVIKALAAEARLPEKAALSEQDMADIEKGRELMAHDESCAQCHQTPTGGDPESAPDLKGYRSREWMIGMISNPDHDRFYGGSGNDRMPAFAESEDDGENLLTKMQIEILVSWLRGEYVPAKSSPEEKDD